VFALRARKALSGTGAPNRFSVLANARRIIAARFLNPNGFLVLSPGFLGAVRCPHLSKPTCFELKRGAVSFVGARIGWVLLFLWSWITLMGTPLTVLQEMFD
jgi:hypothetical protein